MTPEEDASSTKTACPTTTIASVLILPDGEQPVHIELCNWDQIDDFLTRDHDEHPGQWKMFVLNGLHTKLAFELAVRLDIDPGFFDSHVYRTRYVAPWRGEARQGQGEGEGKGKGRETEQQGQGRRGVHFFQLDFPQVEELSIPAGIQTSRSSEMPLLESRWMLDENVLSLAPDARKAYLLDGTLYRWDGVLVGAFGYWRRMSWWCSEREKTSVMVVDGPLEAILPPHVAPALPATQPFRSSVKRQDGGAVEALDGLYARWRARRRRESFLDGFLARGSASSVYEVATDVALQQWHLLVATVQVDRGPSQANYLLELISQRVENNVLDWRRYVRGAGAGAGANPWEDPAGPLPRRRDSALLQMVAGFHDKYQRLERRLPPPSSSSGCKTDALALEVREDRRALDRLSYMGGVLLPFSIAAGVFSMAGRFAAGGALFFAYWVLVVPGVVLATVLVYADTLRTKKVRKVRAARRRPSRLAWMLGGGRRRRENGNGNGSSTSSDTGSVSGESARAAQGGGAAAGGGEAGWPPSGVGAPMPWRSGPRPVWPRFAEDVVMVDETEDLGWWRALWTLVGYRPLWAVDGDVR
ncbi:uncharacterized protein MAM_04062 [Metarhizium album ARSEF 1941]|uniref:Uncharacterized protein n=1 Tax=Metarhizium album (strain ARSEF 1941) TaxID=1081103 RepID=A0A0B2WQH4_METAS|nr:uncharacterized protein MAM_04062 [Metarhizium album ARSEF 1941]KHN98301.1 hypothetical protein MAM_04062 [Metarhizium album ARSEF 1941]